MSAFDDELADVYLEGTTGRDCHHERFVVSMTTAEVSCKACGKPVDVWWALRQIAKMGERFTVPLRYAREEAHRLRQEITALKRQRENLRSQVRRLRGSRDG